MDVLKHSRANDLFDAMPLLEGAASVDPSMLVGTWVSTNANTRGTIKLVLNDEGGLFAVRAFGACEPSPCDWGEVSGELFTAGVGSREAVGFKALYDFGFMETFLAAYLNKRILVVDAYNTFKDGSGRARYFLRDHFYQP
jgi:hypothetical protein